MERNGRRWSNFKEGIGRVIEKLQPTFPELAKQIDKFRKETWREALAARNKADLRVVCGFISFYEDDVIGKCSKCDTEVSVRGWLKKEAEKHSIPIICIRCAPHKIGDPEITIL